MNQKKHMVSKFTFSDMVTKQFSAGDYLTIFYIERGSCHFKIADMQKLCSTEDIILMKPGEKTTMHFRGGKQPLQLLWICVLPEYLEQLSDDTTHLASDFQFIPYKTTVVHAKSEESMLIKTIAAKLSRIESDASLYGHTLYENNLFSMLLILSLRACIRADPVVTSRRKKNIMMDDIFLYIKEHLLEELSLEQLEKEFFVSKYHICREFKRLTGQTPHSYIIKARLDLCKRYIEQGKSIHEVYQLGGFGGYNHFFRAFKKEYGITPKEYYRSLRNSLEN